VGSPCPAGLRIQIEKARWKSPLPRQENASEGQRFENLKAQAYLDRWEAAGGYSHPGTTKRQVAQFAKEKPTCSRCLEPFRYYSTANGWCIWMLCRVKSAYSLPPLDWRASSEWDDLRSYPRSKTGCSCANMYARNGWYDPPRPTRDSLVCATTGRAGRVGGHVVALQPIYSQRAKWLRRSWVFRTRKKAWRRSRR